MPRMRERKPEAYRGSIKHGVLVRPSPKTKAFVDKHLAREGGIIEVDCAKTGTYAEGVCPHDIGLIGLDRFMTYAKHVPEERRLRH